MQTWSIALTGQVGGHLHVMRFIRAVGWGLAQAGPSAFGFGALFHGARSQGAGEPAVSAGAAFAEISAPDRDLPPQGSPGLHPGRYQWSLRLLRAAGGQGGPVWRG